MTYSCALWADGDTLEQAQLRKLDHLIGLAGASGAERVLDVGCGWGALANRLVAGHGVQQVVGVTISESQAGWIAAHAPSAVTVRLQPWDEHVPEAPYDAIISIGAFEHFAQVRSSRAKRMEVFREFFRAMHAALRPGGRLGLQTVAKGAERLDREAIEDFRAVDLAYPASAIPWPSEVLEAAESYFRLESVDVHGDHYRRTTMAWVANLDAVRERALEIVDPDTLERFREGFASAARLFDRGYATLLRLGLRRADSRGGAR
jgi:cyclopropane-fatty-acyl-phospholipid synthase